MVFLPQTKLLATLVMVVLMVSTVSVVTFGLGCDYSRQMCQLGCKTRNLNFLQKLDCDNKCKSSFVICKWRNWNSTNNLCQCVENWINQLKQQIEFRFCKSPVCNQLTLHSRFGLFDFTMVEMRLKIYVYIILNSRTKT